MQHLEDNGLPMDMDVDGHHEVRIKGFVSFGGWISAPYLWSAVHGGLPMGMATNEVRIMACPWTWSWTATMR